LSASHTPHDHATIRLAAMPLQHFILFYKTFILFYKIKKQKVCAGRTDVYNGVAGHRMNHLRAFLCQPGKELGHSHLLQAAVWQRFACSREPELRINVFIFIVFFRFLFFTLDERHRREMEARVHSAL
jgi:hypothetical protein